MKEFSFNKAAGLQPITKPKIKFCQDKKGNIFEEYPFY